MLQGSTTRSDPRRMDRTTRDNDELPLVPGIDGVGRGTDGVLRYFVLTGTTVGSMAEQTVIDLRRSVVLADAVDPVGRTRRQ